MNHVVIENFVLVRAPATFLRELPKDSLDREFWSSGQELWGILKLKPAFIPSPQRHRTNGPDDNKWFCMTTAASYTSWGQTLFRSIMEGEASNFLSEQKADI